MSDLTGILPPMLSGAELDKALRVLPKYTDSISKETTSERLVRLSDIYKVYVPSKMSVEVYIKMYMALLRSLQKKQTRLSVIQQIENRRTIIGESASGIIGGSDSFTIVGESGIGKSSAIGRAIDIIKGEKIIITENPYCKIAPIVSVQCPFDSSVKGLLLEILRKVDEDIGSRYHDNALRGRMTTDMLIGSVAQVCLNHIGLLVVDEIQNVVSSKNGRNLVGVLTQLINSSGISICMVGTEQCIPFFESEMYLARRLLGLQYQPMAFNDYFRKVCNTLLSYRYVREEIKTTESMLVWLFEHSRGNISVLVSLIHDAQEQAIIKGMETIDLQTLRSAYESNLSLLHDYIHSEPKVMPKPIKKQIIPSEKTSFSDNICLSEIIAHAKREGADVVSAVSVAVTVEEVAI